MKMLWSLLIFIVPSLTLAEGIEGYYRYPAISGNTIVFSSEGDLWKSTTKGGIAQRLTTHHGNEAYAHLSGDGKMIAFSGEYHGPREVYAMSIDGGLPRRLSYDGASAIVQGWTPDGKVIYSSNANATLPSEQLYLIDLAEDRILPVELYQADQGDYSSDGEWLYFTRLKKQGSSTKRYKGGTAQQLWKFDGKNEAIPLTTDFAGTSRDPMWYQERIYFASDRDGTMNLWSMDEDGKDLKQLTKHINFDVLSPDFDDGKIVYQWGADLYLYDITAGETAKIDLTLMSDFDQKRTKWIDKPTDFLSAAHISPEGDKIVLTSRGRVFVAPAKKGRLSQISRGQGVRYRDARFTDDNDQILLLSDATGEQEFYHYDAKGQNAGVQLTKKGDNFRFEGIAAPGGKHFTFVDRERRLWLHDIENKKTSVIEVAKHGSYEGMAWSPDGQWLAYEREADNRMVTIKLYNVKTKKSLIATSDRVDSNNPAWSTDGKWLYFLSDRHFRSVVGAPWGPRQPEPFFDKTKEIYALALQKGLEFPFKDADELDVKPDDGNDKPKKDIDKKKKPVVKVEIDEDGLIERLHKVPLPAGKYSDLALNDKRFFFVDHNPIGKKEQTLKSVEFKNDKIKPETLAEKILSFELSANGKKALIALGCPPEEGNDGPPGGGPQKICNFRVIDANGKGKDAKGKGSNAGGAGKPPENMVNLSAWKFAINPQEEWRNMLIDAYRMERDYFYDPGMHGADWDAVLERHLALADRLTSRDDVNDLLKQMVGEMEALHISVRRGDLRVAKDNVKASSLGARFSRDTKSGGYHISRIFQHDPDYFELRSPLSRPEGDIKEGDVITRVNGISTLDVAHISELLQDQAGKQVRLKITSGKNVKDFIVVPLSMRNDANLRYTDWEISRRNIVEEKSKSQIGYMHLRAMGNRNYTEFVKAFYPVFERSGLIIDVRHNRGGNIDSWLFEKLMRKAVFHWKARGQAPSTNMQYAFRGHLVVLVNEKTASDGEAFAEGFRRLGLGKIIGTRTWGGEIWLSYNTPLSDNGMPAAAQSGVYGPEGEWLIEGHGVDPDIVVDNLPHATFKGEDAQLDAAIEHLQELIEKDPRLMPQAPPFPDMGR